MKSFCMDGEDGSMTFSRGRGGTHLFIYFSSSVICLNLNLQKFDI